MKLKVRSDDDSTLREHGWPQMEMGDWLAQLRDDSRDEPPDDSRDEPPGDRRDEPPGDGHAGADDPDRPRQGALTQADVRAYAQADAGARVSAHVGADTSAGETGRAVIGDQLRMPIMWCEMGSCISWYTDPAALGEADTRARAIGAGWRIDALGRLACPCCQQTDPHFWASHPVVPWDRYAAIARASRGAAVSGEGTTDSVTGGTSHGHGRAASGFSPATRPERESHHEIPNAQAMPAGGFAESPVATATRAARPWRAVRARLARGGQAAASPSQ